MASDACFCTFRLAGLLFGIEVESVQEVIRSEAITPVPLASRGVAGLMNLRGRIVTVLEPRWRLGLPEGTAGKSLRNLVVLRPDAIALLVDELGNVMIASPESWQVPPVTLPTEARQLLAGVYQLPSELLHAIAVQALIHDTDG